MTEFIDLLTIIIHSCVWMKNDRISSSTYSVIYSIILTSYIQVENIHFLDIGMHKLFYIYYKCCFVQLTTTYVGRWLFWAYFEKSVHCFNLSLSSFSTYTCVVVENSFNCIQLREFFQKTKNKYFNISFCINDFDFVVFLN